MTFTDIFGKTYKRNPNLVDTHFSIEQKDFMANELRKHPAVVEWRKLLLDPIIQKLECDENEFLTSELKFLKEVLYHNKEQSYRSNDLAMYNVLLAKLESYLSQNYIKANRRKAEL